MNPVIQAHSERVVPFEPTEAMEKAFNAICPVGEDFGDAWSAACAAAPTKTKPTQQDAVDAAYEACAQIAFDADHMGSVNMKLMKDRIGNAIRAAISAKKVGAA